MQSSSVSDKALAKARFIFDNTSNNHYAHTSGKADDQVDVESDSVSSCTDCSGFISYVLKSTAKKHYEMVVDFCSGKRPRANNYADYFAQLASQPAAGWQSIASINDLKPGDLIAWVSPHYEEYHQGNSGHVMMVSGSPGQSRTETIGGQSITYVPVPVIDSSSVSHFPPESLPPKSNQKSRDGVGMGQVRVVIDGQGKAVGYWEGTYWGEGQKEIHNPTMSDNVSFARIVGFRSGT